MITKNLTISHHGRNISANAYLPKKETYPLVIFSHGFNGSGDDFITQATLLAKNGIGVFTYDFCGGALHSKSDMRTEEMTVFTEKDDLCAILDFVKNLESVDVNNIFLFGASMGGLVSALAADERSDEIKGLILLYPALCVANDWNKNFPDINNIPAIHKVWGVPLGKQFFESLHGFNVFEHIGKYPKNVLIMHGDKDSIVPPEYSKQANKIYKNSELIIFGKEGHGFSAESDKRVTEMIVNFLKAEVCGL